MERDEFIAARAERLAYAVFGLSVAVSDLGPSKDQTIRDMAGWLHINGGDAFVLKLADAIKAEQVAS